MRKAALLAALAGVALACAAAPGARALDERFKGIPVDRCKELGGPPTWVEEGPRIVSVSVPGGRAGEPVVVRWEGPPGGGVPEVHFLWKGKDLAAPVESSEGPDLRVRVPGMGPLRGKQSGWIYLSRGEIRGKARPFQFLPDQAGAAPGPAAPPPGR